MKYTEQEKETIMHLSYESQRGSDAVLSWEELPADVRAEWLAEFDTKWDWYKVGQTGRVIATAARLMREAREQGAKQMRERAACVARDNGGDVLDIDRLIRDLPLTVPQ